MSDEYIGYIKYRGKLVEDGMMDARKQAEALLCADSAIRSFLAQQSPDIRKFDFEIPVKIQRGSWELLIPENVGLWAQAGLAVVATAYFSKAAQKMAENDFSEVGVKDLFLKSIDSLKWFVRIGKHLGTVSLRKFDNPKFTDNNSIIGIPNSQGEYLYIPKNIFDSYINSEPMVLDKLAQFIEKDRELVIATIDEEGVDEEAINKEQKGIFCSSENEEEEEPQPPRRANPRSDPTTEARPLQCPRERNRSFEPPTTRRSDQVLCGERIGAVRQPGPIE